MKRLKIPTPILDIVIIGGTLAFAVVMFILALTGCSSPELVEPDAHAVDGGQCFFGPGFHRCDAGACAVCIGTTTTSPCYAGGALCVTSCDDPACAE